MQRPYRDENNRLTIPLAELMRLTYEEGIRYFQNGGLYMRNGELYWYKSGTSIGPEIDVFVHVTGGQHNYVPKDSLCTFMPQYSSEGRAYTAAHVDGGPIPGYPLPFMPPESRCRGVSFAALYFDHGKVYRLHGGEYLLHWHLEAAREVPILYSTTTNEAIYLQPDAIGCFTPWLAPPGHCIEVVMGREGV